MTTRETTPGYALEFCWPTFFEKHTSVPKNSLAAKVYELEQSAGRRDELLAQIIATLSISKNRAVFVTMDDGNEFLRIADNWIERYKKMKS